MKKRKILLLAKFLSEIHSQTLPDFYTKRPSSFWQELESTTTNSEEVDRMFFIEMAKSIDGKLNKKVSSNDLDNSSPLSSNDRIKKENILVLAQILADVHGFNLSPFYEDSTSPVWEELEEKTDNPKDVDKLFFKRMAKKILASIEDVS